MSNTSAESPATTPLKLLWLNPVNTSTYDQEMADMLARVKLPNTEVHVVSLDLGPDVCLTNLEWRAFESKIWGPVAHVAYHAGREGYHGCAVGCFYDTALDEAREVSGNTVVTGPCQSALQIVSNLCNRFSVVIGVEKWKVQMQERIEHYGYGEKLASFRNVGLHVDEFQKDPACTEGAIRRAVREAIEIDKAEAIILGCTMEFGFYRQLQKEFGVPVIDALYACFKGTEYAALNALQFGWTPSQKYSMEPPTPQQIEASGVFNGPVPIGNRVVVPRG